MTRAPGWFRAALTAGLAALACSASVAHAAPTVNGTQVTPRTVDAGTKQVLYYLDLATGPQEGAFSVRLVPPRFATKGGRSEGESIDGPRKVALQGPGELGQLVQDARFSQPCSDRDAAFHGYATGAASVDVLLPPNSATTLAVRYLTGRRAPWVDGDYRLTFVVQPRLVGEYLVPGPFFGKQASAFTAVTRRTAGPTVRGRTGAHLLLSTSPAGTWGEAKAPRRIRPGQTVRVSGRLLPAIKDRRIDLQVRAGRGRLTTLTAVRTDARGRFSARWTPRRPGTYELWARYPRQPGSLAADTTSCPLRFSAGR